jgi:hypothetical protein
VVAHYGPRILHIAMQAYMHFLTPLFQKKYAYCNSSISVQHFRYLRDKGLELLKKSIVLDSILGSLGFFMPKNCMLHAHFCK